MGRVKRQWHAGLLPVLMAVHVGCAARGRADSLRDPGDAPPVAVVSVAAGDDRVRVTRNGFAEAWAEETGRCTRDLLLPVAIGTYGIGLVFLPAICGGMTAATPGMTTGFKAGRMRRGIEQSLASGNLHATLRGGIAAAAHAAGRPIHTLPGEEPQPTGDPGRGEAILEVTVSEVAIRDDGTLASVSARARVLRATDQAQLHSRTFRQEASRRQTWWVALEPTLSELSAAIVAAMVPDRGPAAVAGFRPGEEP
jgi:hypothetical protein